MKLVLETTICDACLAWKGTEVAEAVEVVPVAPGRTLALCPEHRDGLSRVFGLIAEFADEVATAGRKRNGRSAAAIHRAVPSTGVPAVTEGKRNKRGGARARARRNNSAPVARSVELVEDRHACPLCTHTGKTTAALGVHIRDMHSRTLSEVYGRVCPLCGSECTTTGALGVHGATSHGVERGGGVITLFARARDEGDPLGVIASRAAAIVEAATH